MTFAREQEVKPHLSDGALLGVEVLSVVVMLTCDGCRELIYRRVEYDHGRVEVVQRALRSGVVAPAENRFAVLEID